MDAEQFQALRQEALKLFKTQPKTDRISLDAIFAALVDERTDRPEASYRSVKQDPPPAWFDEAVKKLRGSGERLAITRFLMLAGRFPTSREETYATGRWLRRAGFTARKVGGQILFEF